MDLQNFEWSDQMSDSLMNVNGLKILSQYVKSKQNPLLRILSLQTLHLMSFKKSLINFMLSYGLTDAQLLNLEDPIPEVTS